MKYKSKCFKLMSEQEVSIHSKALLLKIHVITGWSIPEDKYLIIFQDQLRKKIAESYPMVNPDEVEYAFRTFGTQVKDWGKQMNLSLIDEVMIPYLEQRKEVSKIEEQKKALPAPIQDLSDEETDNLIKRYKSQNTDVRLLPDFLYQWLRDNGRIQAVWNQEPFLSNSIAFRKSEIMKGLESDPGNKTLINDRLELKRMLAQGYLEEPEISRIESLSKKLIIRDYINSL